MLRKHELLTNMQQDLGSTEQRRGRDNLGLASVAASGSYTDLVNTPGLPTATFETRDHTIVGTYDPTLSVPQTITLPASGGSTAAVYGSTQDTPGDNSTTVLMFDTWYMDSFGQIFGNKIYWKNGDPDTHKLIMEPGKYIIRTEWFLNWTGTVDYHAHIVNGCTEDFSYHWQKYVDRQAIRNLPVTIEFSTGFTFDSATPAHLSITPASLIIQEVV